mmetsp:Transcript_20088/g.43457  ORF Transcript_20088/g.43457 Transcript_20088/m.43457 type:complete len:453 (-) Transcript_20088:226-1584(-)
MHLKHSWIGLTVVLSSLSEYAQGKAVYACGGKCTSPTLAQAAASRGISIGVAADFIKKSAEHKQEVQGAIEANFGGPGGVFTAENACKIQFVRPSRHEFNFTLCDEHLAFAKKAGMEFRYHTLFWDKWNPAWIDQLRASEIKEVMTEHVNKIMEHYGADLDYIDVVNEHARKRGFGVWGQMRGFIYEAFRITREAATEGQKLVMNENGADLFNWRARKAYQVAKILKRQGNLDAIGLQMHLTCKKMLNRRKYSSIAKNFRMFQSLGLEIHLTEIDIRACRNERLLKIAYRKLGELCRTFPSCKVIQTWGVADHLSWINIKRAKLNNAPHTLLLFDNEYKARPATLALVNALNGMTQMTYETDVDTVVSYGISTLRLTSLEEDMKEIDAAEMREIGTTLFEYFDKPGYVIPFDGLIVWIGYSKKAHAKRMLGKYFKEDEDFTKRPFNYGSGHS